jgi:CBS domain-containing protein
LMLALAGPLMSGALGALSLGIGFELAGRAPGQSVLGDDAALLALGPAPLLALWLGAVNIALVAGVLAPAFPLDGGRVLRSALWAATGDLTKATRWAVAAGRAFALLLVVCGVFGLLHGAFAAGLWLALLGWLLNDTARRSYEQVWRQEACKNAPLERLMRTDVMRVDRDLTVDEFVRGYLTRTPQLAFPVEDHGRLLGILRLSDVRKLPQQEWTRTRAVQVMRGVDEVPALPPDAAAREALDALSRRNLEQLPVVDRDHLVGLVTRSDLLQWIEPRGQRCRSPRSTPRVNTPSSRR